MRRVYKKPIAKPRKRRERKQPPALADSSDDLPAAFKARQRFFDLVRDTDPAAMDIAEDLALEQGFKLTDLSETSHSSTDASGNFKISPLYPADATHKSVTWVADRRGSDDKGKTIFTSGLKVTWNNEVIWNEPKLDKSKTLATARRRAAALAWVVTKRLKHLPPDTDPSRVKDEIWVATRDLSVARIPKELLGRKRAK